MYCNYNYAPLSILKPPSHSLAKSLLSLSPIFYRQLLRPLSKAPMSSKNPQPETPQPKPGVNKVQLFVNSDPSGGWDKCWEEGVTPWDLGRPTPVLQHLIQTESLPKGRALVPGCGSGYDVVALASPERYVIGLDISDVAIRKAREMASRSSNANYVSFLKEDFFTWKPNDLFDLIFDYTFFCALEPRLRPAWADRMRDLLKPDGELITLMFPIDDYEGGPPYSTSVADYEEVLHSAGFQSMSIVDNELAIAPRKGREKLGRWRVIRRASLL